MSSRDEIFYYYCFYEIALTVKFDSYPLVYSLAGPVVGYGAVQRYSVAEVCVVTVLLPQVFSVALLGWRQCGREAAFSPTPEALNQTQRFGQTWVRQTRLPVKIL